MKPVRPISQNGGRRLAYACAVFLTAAVPVRAAAPALAPTAVAQAISDCRKIADRDARLDCYDKAAGAFDQAQAQGQVVVVDREQVKTVRRQSFGFNIPSIAIFSHGAKDEPITNVTLDLASAHQSAEGRWVMTTTDDAVWRQTDTTQLYDSPRQGSKMAVRKGALGSFFCKIDDQTSIRCAREH